MKFEYKQVAVLYKDLDECLQLASNEDWELTHMASSGIIGGKDNIYMLIFKRTTNADTNERHTNTNETTKK